MLEIITSRDAKSACFKGSRTSCEEIFFGIFLAEFWPEKITSRDGCFLPNEVASAPTGAMKHTHIDVFMVGAFVARLCELSLSCSPNTVNEDFREFFC